MKYFATFVTFCIQWNCNTDAVVHPSSKKRCLSGQTGGIALSSQTIYQIIFKPFLHFRYANWATFNTKFQFLGGSPPVGPLKRVPSPTPLQNCKNFLQFFCLKLNLIKASPLCEFKIKWRFYRHRKQLKYYKVRIYVNCDTFKC